MASVKRKRPVYPRINCSVPGCKRGTTTFEPGTRAICGKCWRKAPQAHREAYSRWRRRARAFDKRENPRAELCWRRSAFHFDHILELLSNPTTASGEIPPLMGEELRKAGLL